MAKHVQGSAVANATSYKLFEKNGTNYTEKATQSIGGNIDFDLSALAFAAGTHQLVVKAYASGYLDSAYSNEVSYVVQGTSTGTKIVDEITGVTMSGGTYGSGGSMYGVNVSLPAGTYISEIVFPACAGSKYANPTSSISIQEIVIYRVDTAGVISDELARVSNLASEPDASGMHCYRVPVNKTLSAESDLAFLINPADTSKEPTVPYCTGMSANLGKCYFGNVKAPGTTISFTTSNYYPAFAVYS